jgi:RNA polymerase sigma-70 factor (ECF subfamily)
MKEHAKESLGATAASTDQELFLSLIDSHQRLLMKVCWTYTYSSHDRDDLYQEIVGRLWSAFGMFDQDRRFSTWMYRVALNVAIDFRRRRKRREGVKSLEETPEQVAAEDVFRNELSRELHELLEQQNDADRAILLLYLEGNSYRDIAEVLGISESNVGTRLNRLKESLRQTAGSSGDN